MTNRAIFRKSQTKITQFGFEQDGTGKKFSRPVLILKGFSSRVYLVIPLTTSPKKNPYHVFVGKIGDRKAAVIIPQLRFVDTHRLDQQIEVLNKEKFAHIRKAAKELL